MNIFNHIPYTKSKMTKSNKKIYAKDTYNEAIALLNNYDGIEYPIDVNQYINHFDEDTKLVLAETYVEHRIGHHVTTQLWLLTKWFLVNRNHKCKVVFKESSTSISFIWHNEHTVDTIEYRLSTTIPTSVNLIYQILDSGLVGSKDSENPFVFVKNMFLYLNDSKVIMEICKHSFHDFNVTETDHKDIIDLLTKTIKEKQVKRSLPNKHVVKESRDEKALDIYLRFIGNTYVTKETREVLTYAQAVTI